MNKVKYLLRVEYENVFFEFVLKVGFKIKLVFLEVMLRNCYVYM